MVQLQNESKNYSSIWFIWLLQPHVSLHDTIINKNSHKRTSSTDVLVLWERNSSRESPVIRLMCEQQLWKKDRIKLSSNGHFSEHFQCSCVKRIEVDNPMFQDTRKERMRVSYFEHNSAIDYICHKTYWYGQTFIDACGWCGRRIRKPHAVVALWWLNVYLPKLAEVWLRAGCMGSLLCREML